MQQTAADAFTLILGHRNEDAHEKKRSVFHVRVSLCVHGAEEVIAQGHVGTLGPFFGPGGLIRCHAIDVEIPPCPRDDFIFTRVGCFDKAGARVGAEEVFVLLCAVVDGLFAGETEGYGEVGLEGYVFDMGETDEIGFGCHRCDGVCAGGEPGRCFGGGGGADHADVGVGFGDADGG